MVRQQKLPRGQKRAVQRTSSSQPYDNALKALMGDHAAEIIPEFIPEAAVVIEQNNEIKQENLRADLVYFIHYENELHVLNMELQTNSDSDMPGRMLRYHVGLHLDYNLPVLSVILYLFETSVPTPPYREMSGKKEQLTFHYLVIALWTLDAREYVEKRAIAMYTFLPGMKGANVALLKEAIDGMKQRYTRKQLARHLTRFRTILHRSKMLSESDKQIVEDYMQSYDSLLDSDPYIQQKLAKKATESEIRALQEVALEAVEDQYPALMPFAKEKIVLIRKPDLLRLLVKQIYKAPDEKIAQLILDTYTG
ncbi:MAG TPA: hypothetical protein VFQ36_08735 [Ktedonobacteraceae bacterium]|nr:hypothetical protein [Ktedonobacteraceae bacterium]